MAVAALVTVGSLYGVGCGGQAGGGAGGGGSSESREGQTQPAPGQSGQPPGGGDPPVTRPRRSWYLPPAGPAEPEIYTSIAYKLLASGECRKALDHAKDQTESHAEIFEKLYVAGAYACLGNVSQAEATFQEFEELEKRGDPGWPPAASSEDNPEGDIIRNRVGCIYNAVVRYLQINRTLMSCKPEATTPSSTAPDSTTPDSTTPDSTTPDSTTPDSTTPDSTTEST
jgi:hypothetical protein